MKWWNKIQVLAVGVVCACTLFPAGAHAVSISDYTAFPPFLPRVVSPNILFLVDYSETMVRPAYGRCDDLVGDCEDTFVDLADDYDPSIPYYGYFDNGSVDSAGNEVSPYADTLSAMYSCSAGGVCVKDATSGQWNGNFLNWLTMTQFDVLKKVFVGGDITSSPDASSPASPDITSILKDLEDDGDPRQGKFYKSVSAAAASGRAPAVTMTTPQHLPYEWVEESEASGSVTTTHSTVYDEDDYVGADLPFTFSFYGKEYSKAFVSDNGYLRFFEGDTTTLRSTYKNRPLGGTDDDYNRIIAPWWDDWYLPLGGTVKSFVVGEAPNRVFVVTWDSMIHFYDVYSYDESTGTYYKTSEPDHPMTFQVLLYEGSNNIVFQYEKATKSTTEADSDVYWREGLDGTVGVESHAPADGSDVPAKNWTYLGSPRLLRDGMALHATPEAFLTHIVPRTNNPTVFQPAPPLADGKTNDFRVDITATRVAKNTDGSCPTGYYPNEAIGETGGDKTKDYCYTHVIDGLFHELSAGLQAGSLGFRLAAMRVGVANQGTDGGNITNKGIHFNEKASSNLLTATRGDTPGDYAPLSEGLYEAGRYFQQMDPYWGTEYDNYDGDLLGVNCAPTGNDVNTDPFCFQDADQKVPCVKSFVLLVSAGEYSHDWGLNIDSTSRDTTEEDIPNAVKKLAPDEKNVDMGYPEHGGYLDNIAYYLHTTDLRSDVGLDLSDQVINFYAVNTFGGGDSEGSNVLKRAALLGSFEDADGDGIYDTGEGDPASPDSYFSASGGSSIKDQIYEAISDILKSSASGTSVSVLSTSAGGEGALYQAYFYPAKVKENTAEEADWPGYLRSFFIDRYQQIRDDYSGTGTKNAKLEPDLDRVAMMHLNEADFSVKVDLYDTDETGELTYPLPDPPDAGSVSIESVLSIWEGGEELAKQDKSQRRIYLWNDADRDGVVDNGDFSSLGGEAVSFTNSLATTLKYHLQAKDSVDPADGTITKTADTEAGEIIDFIRGNSIATGYRNRCIAISGQSRDTANCDNANEQVWPLGDIVYSTPTLVSRPAEKYDVIYGDVSYRNFTQEHKDRRQVIYVGANDGMLHAFNAGVYHEGDDDPNDSTVVTGYFEPNPASGNGWSSPTPGLGDELWSFIPHDNLPHLAWLGCSGTDTDPQICGSAEYTHVYYVDHRPKVTDVRIFNDTATNVTGLVDGQAGASHPDGWGTIMIVPLRMGGGAIDLDLNNDGDTLDAGEQDFRSAYYCFDITDPEKPPKLLWRFTHSDLGFTTSYPAIVRIADNDKGKWFMTVGSGPTNTPTQRDYAVAATAKAGKLFVVDLLTGSLAGTTPSPITLHADNAVIGDPTAVDADLDYSTDVIYVGSAYQNTAGRVFRINTLGDTDPSNWVASTLFDVDPDTNKSGPDPDLNEEMGPLLLAPGVSKDIYGNLWVFFGSGRLLNSDDLDNSDQQRFYGIKDGCWKSTDSADGCDATTSPNYAYGLADLFNASAVEVTTDKNGASQVVDTTNDACGGTTTCSYSTLLSNASSAKGWYVDLDTSGANSERILSRPAVLGGLVMFTSYEPASDLCSVLGDSALYALYYETGTAYIEDVVGTYEDDSGTEYVNKAIDLGVGMPTSVGVAIGETVSGFVQKSTGEIVRVEAAPGLSVRSGVDSWRESSGGGAVEIESIYKHIVK